MSAHSPSPLLAVRPEQHAVAPAQPDTQLAQRVLHEVSLLHLARVRRDARERREQLLCDAIAYLMPGGIRPLQKPRSCACEASVSQLRIVMLTLYHEHAARRADF
jgi:hypothetical protein